MQQLIARGDVDRLAETCERGPTVQLTELNTRIALLVDVVERASQLWQLKRVILLQVVLLVGEQHFGSRLKHEIGASASSRVFVICLYGLAVRRVARRLRNRRVFKKATTSVCLQYGTVKGVEARIHLLLARLPFV